MGRTHRLMSFSETRLTQAARASQAAITSPIARIQVSVPHVSVWNRHLPWLRNAKLPRAMSAYRVAGVPLRPQGPLLLAACLRGQCLRGHRTPLAQPFRPHSTLCSRQSPTRLRLSTPSLYEFPPSQFPGWDSQTNQSAEVLARYDRECHPSGECGGLTEDREPVARVWGGCQDSWKDLRRLTQMPGRRNFQIPMYRGPGQAKAAPIKVNGNTIQAQPSVWGDGAPPGEGTDHTENAEPSPAEIVKSEPARCHVERCGRGQDPHSYTARQGSGSLQHIKDEHNGNRRSTFENNEGLFLL